MSNVPDGAQLSDDGNWWWDGTQWQPVQASSGTPSTAHDDPTANPGYLGSTDEADTPFADDSMQEVNANECPDDPNRYCVYAGAKYSVDSVKCMDDHVLHTCRMYKEQDGVYRASWSQSGNPC